ncbi:MAG: hypothetical protein IKA79_00020 [Lentisphaeria bacterium]|nr:hypothetical protein [Lentisphaeria bacterium]
MYIVGLFSRSSVMKLGKWIGNMMYIIPVFGGLCRKNIRAAFPEKTEDEVKEIARKSLQNLALTALEFFWIRRHRDKFEDLIDLTELHEVALQGQAMMKEGKGTILITPHLGNWEFGGKILALTYKYKMATVVRSSRNPYLDKLISGTRSHSGDVEIIYSKGGAIAMKKALDSGKALGILIDQNVKLRHGGIFVNLFGLPVPVSRAPATLGRHKNRFIAVGVCFRQEDGSFRAYLRRLPKEPCEYESDEELTQAITTLSEEYIRMAPEQYLWMYKRFQHIPEGVPEEVVRRFPDYAKKVKRSFYTRCPARNKK